MGSGGKTIPWISGHRRPEQNCSGGLGEDGVAAGSGSHPFPALPMAVSATHHDRGHLLAPWLAVAPDRGNISTMAKQMVLLLLSPEVITLLPRPSPEAVGAAMWVIAGMPNDQQNMMSEMQKYFY